MALSWQQSSQVLGQNPALGSIASLLSVSPHYYLLDHHYYIHNYPVITTPLPIIMVICLHDYSLIHLILLDYYFYYICYYIIITNYYQVIITYNCSNNGSIITHYY